MNIACRRLAMQILVIVRRIFIALYTNERVLHINAIYIVLSVCTRYFMLTDHFTCIFVMQHTIHNAGSTHFMILTLKLYFATACRPIATIKKVCYR